MTNNYYELIMNSYEKEAGSISSPNWDKCPRILDSEDVVLDKDFTYELVNGRYCPFDLGPHCVRLVNEELKEYLPSLLERWSFEMYWIQ